MGFMPFFMLYVIMLPSFHQYIIVACMPRVILLPSLHQYIIVACMPRGGGGALGLSNIPSAPYVNVAYLQ